MFSSVTLKSVYIYISSKRELTSKLPKGLFFKLIGSNLPVVADKTGMIWWIYSSYVEPVSDSLTGLFSIYKTQFMLELESLTKVFDKYSSIFYDTKTIKVSNNRLDILLADGDISIPPNLPALLTDEMVYSTTDKRELECVLNECYTCRLRELVLTSRYIQKYPCNKDKSIFCDINCTSFSVILHKGECYFAVSKFIKNKYYSANFYHNGELVSDINLSKILESKLKLSIL